MIFFLLCCTATSSFLYTCGLSYSWTQLQVSQNPSRRVLLMQLSVSLSPFCLTATLAVLATNSHCEWCRWAWTIHWRVLTFLHPPFFRCWDKSMASVCFGKTTCQKWMARLHVRGVRACVHALSPPQQRLIPSRSHRNDGSLWAVEFSDHVQTLPWASPSQYSQK